MRRGRVFPLVLALAACTDDLPTGPTKDPQFDIADAATDYKAGFYWLPPIVKPPVVAGNFDAGLSPVVEICELVDNTCGPVIATFTTTDGPDGELVQVNVENEHYFIKWHTDRFALNLTALYRVSVRAGVRNVLLGYADVQPVSNGRELKNVDTGEYIGLIDGRTLIIKFRIETGIVAHVEVQPPEASIDPGGTQQFVAIVRDLHDQIINADVSWFSSDVLVAFVDQNGLATAVGDGFTTITAMSQRISGSATLTVDGGVAVISAGEEHTCTLGKGGRAYCWGIGLWGQLGNGSIIFQQFSPLAVAGGLTFAAIETGRVHTCALTPTGQAYCWGFNFRGEIGNGSGDNSPCYASTLPCRLTPTEVLGGLSFISISAGNRNTCALTADHQAYCWGAGFAGALGNGTLADARTPSLVSGGHNFISISTGSDATCGVTITGEGYCWGQGQDGRLGNGTTVSTLAPTPVAGGLAFTTISVGYTHACGITTTGQAYCWGHNFWGKLGNGLSGSSANQTTPVPVSGGLIFSSISAGQEHTCGVTTTGQGYCWGEGGDGELGIGGFPLLRTTPVLVAGGLTWRSIEVGAYHSCGVTVENQRYCWGRLAYIGSLTGSHTVPALVNPLP
jgi:alpha-tubulin suppressor-like RCC1 family protein